MNWVAFIVVFVWIAVSMAIQGKNEQDIRNLTMRVNCLEYATQHPEFGAHYESGNTEWPYRCLNKDGTEIFGWK